MRKYDYRALIDACMNERGQFLEGKLFEEIGASSISYERGYKAALGCRVNFSPEYRKCFCHYDIIISQNGAELRIGTLGPKKREKEILIEAVNQAVPKLLAVWRELEKYMFEAVAYELWSDAPDTPYYIPAGKKSLALKVVPISESE